MKIQINQWGNSLALRIPKPFADQLNIGQGSEVEMSIEENAIVISKPKYSLDGLLKNITPNNIHGETDSGTPVGIEVW